MLSEAKRRANAKYAKEKTVRKTLSFYGTDKDVLEWLATKDNVQGYIKGLIREDMDRSRREA